MANRKAYPRKEKASTCRKPLLSDPVEHSEDGEECETPSDNDISVISDNDQFDVSPRQDRINCAATFRMDSKSKQVPPETSHYEVLSFNQPRPGYIYRIHKPNNSTMDLQTFIVIKTFGCSFALLKIVRNSSLRDTKFDQHHVRILKEKQKDQLAENEKLPYLIKVFMTKGEDIHSDCWVNVERSYNMGDDDAYKIAFCGELTPDSYTWLLQEHMRQYGAR